jgi:hypothetical protein
MEEQTSQCLSNRDRIGLVKLVTGAISLLENRSTNPQAILKRNISASLGPVDKPGWVSHDTLQREKGKWNEDVSFGLSDDVGLR